MKKRILSILLTMTMLMSLMASMCISASAETATPLDSSFTGGKLINGDYYLTSNITLNKKIIIAMNNEVNLNLNGYVIDCTNSGSNGFLLEEISTLNISDDKDTVHHFTEGSNGEWIWDSTEQATTHTVKGGVITSKSDYPTIKDSNGCGLNLTNVNLVGGECGIFFNQSASWCNVENCKFYGFLNCAIYLDDIDNVTKISNSEFKFNKGKQGAAIYSDGAALHISDTVISDNIATQNGGGIYLKWKDPNCLAEGTKITMADGSKKNIEEIETGDVVKTFDHEAGKLSSSKVYIAYAGESKDKPFTLHFTNNTELGVAGIHDLLLKDTLKYVSITESNAKQYIGKKFYNATTNSWETLLDVTYSNEYCNYYSIYTANHFNCIANDMITVPDDIDYMLNIYELDENLKADADILNADIEKYGLFDYDTVKEIGSEQYFNDSNMKYLNIVAGKGLKSIDDMLGAYKPEYDENNIQLFSVKFQEDVSGNNFIIYKNVIIKDNILKSDTTEEPENVYVLIDDGHSYQIKIDSVAENNDVGVTLSSGKGFVFESNLDNAKEYIKSDKGYLVKTEKNGTTNNIYFDEGKFNSSVDSGYYATTATDENKSGIIAFTTQIPSISTYKDVTEFGYYLYNGSAVKKAELTKETVTDLTTLEGWFYGFVKDIAVTDFAKSVVAKPYIKSSGSYYFGNAITGSVNADKWLGQDK